ncbi:MAG: hypothetical protein D6759_02790 [Chloroflexi bacterium]|nr:MAG: hypothetical protein D6759_02790 [Chloroflexota bacterium]
MALVLPESVQRVLGEEAGRDLVDWLQGLLSERAISREEWRQLLSRLDILEHDVAEVKTELQELRREMNERFDRMNERFDRMNERFDRMNERFDTMYERLLVHTRWTIGVLSLFGTILAILVAIGQLSP